MSSQPKRKDYGPSATEQIQASIAKADVDYFASTYDPLLVEMRDKAATEDVASTLRGRAQADTMQALTGPQAQGGGAGLSIAEDTQHAANLAIGATGQILAANQAAKDVKVTEQVGVLGTVRGQAADAGDALARSARLATSEGLSKAKAKQDVRLARRGAAFKVGIAVGGKMLKNIGETGSFLSAKTGMGEDAGCISWTIEKLTSQTSDICILNKRVLTSNLINIFRVQSMISSSLVTVPL